MSNKRRKNTANLILRNPLVKTYFDLVEAHERVIKEKEAALDRGSIFNRKEVDYCLVKVLSAKLFVIYKMIKIAEEEIEKHKYDLVSSPTEF